MTILEAYETGCRRLRDAEILPADEARATVRIALDHLSGARYAHLARPDRVLTVAEQARWNEWLDQLARGRPLAYLIGERAFLGLNFRCDERALIPRPETELLVEAAVARLKEYSAPRVADLGTGSGAIAIGVAHLLPRAQVWASDVSPGSLSLARENAERLGVAQRLHFVAGENGQWAAPLLGTENGARFDAVLSNPPYIARRGVETLPPQIRDHEPRAALDGGEDGLDDYRRIAAQCDALLNAEGFLMVELGAGQFEAARTIFNAAGWTVEEPLYDLGGVARVLAATR